MISGMDMMGPSHTVPWKANQTQHVNSDDVENRQRR